jgi:anti-sigma factor RsiW
MDCRQCSDNLTAFLDGELDAADLERVQSHLAACLSCSEELTGLRETTGFVESHCRNLEPRPESWRLIRSRIGEAQAPSASLGSLFSRFRWATAFTVIAAIFAFGYVQYQQVQKKNLDRYISQYIEERKSQITRQLTVESPYEGNPFMEARATVIENPFLSEGR